MQVKDLLAPEDVLLIAAPAKRDVLRRLAEHAASRLDADAADVLKALLQREALGSTGIGKGIALPHARLDAVVRPQGTFAVLSRPVEYGAIDDKPVDLVFQLLLPAEVPDLQVTPLACVARRFRSPGLSEQLRAAGDCAALFDLLTGP